MPTSKTRLNLALDEKLDQAITQLAKNEASPKATTAARLLWKAIELEEDYALTQIANKRHDSLTKTLNHKEVWG